MNSRFNGVVGNLDVVVSLIFIVQTFEDFDSFLLRGFADNNGLKTSFKCGVFFNIFAVFIERCCADNLKLAPCKRGL